MKISFSFKWFDLWIGLYIDIEKDIWYICPLPCCVIKIQFIRYYKIVDNANGYVIGYCKSTDIDDEKTLRLNASYLEISKKEYILNAYY